MVGGKWWTKLDHNSLVDFIVFVSRIFRLVFPGFKQSARWFLHWNMLIFRMLTLFYTILEYNYYVKRWNRSYLNFNEEITAVGSFEVSIRCRRGNWPNIAPHRAVLAHLPSTCCLQGLAAPSANSGFTAYRTAERGCVHFLNAVANACVGLLFQDKFTWLKKQSTVH